MKNKLTTLASAIVLLLSALIGRPAFATSFTINLTGSVTFENPSTLTISVGNLVDFTGDCNGLCGLTATLEYDADKIEVTGISSTNGFQLTRGTRLVFYQSTGVGAGTVIGTISYKNKSLTSGEATTITLKNLTATNGNQEFSSANVSKTVTYKKTEPTPPAEKPAEKPTNQPATKPAGNQNQNQNQSQKPAASTNPTQDTPADAPADDPTTDEDPQDDEEDLEPDTSDREPTKQPAPAEPETINKSSLPSTPALVGIIIGGIALITGVVILIFKKK